MDRGVTLPTRALTKEVGALPLSSWRAPFVPCMIRDIGDRGVRPEVWR
jgi:hypothetical protein